MRAAHTMRVEYRRPHDVRAWGIHPSVCERVRRFSTERVAPFGGLEGVWPAVP
jgi:hypothetical protein